MKFEEFIKGKVFYTKDGQWVTLNKLDEQQEIQACKSNEYFHVVKGNMHYVDVIIFKEKDFEECRLCNSFL